MLLILVIITWIHLMGMDRTVDKNKQTNNVTVNKLLFTQIIP